MIKFIRSFSFLSLCFFSHSLFSEQTKFSSNKPDSPHDNLNTLDLEASQKDRVIALQTRVAEMKEFARRARFTPEGLDKFNTKLGRFERELALLQGAASSPPTLSEWIRGGKKIPEGMMFTGGSPWFNEQTGKNREPREVYTMIYGKMLPPAMVNPKPTVPSSRPQSNFVKRKPFPKHWGDPPRRQTRDLRPLPGGYGMGSGTLGRWIQENLDRDQKKESSPD